VSQYRSGGELIAGKRRVFEAYRERLGDLPVRMNPEPLGTVNGYWMPTIVVDEGTPFDRDALLLSFREQEIDGRVFFWPLSMLPMFAEARSPPVSRGLYSRAVNLPSYHELADADVDRVVGCIRGGILTR
jgi:perosamine synthetase